MEKYFNFEQTPISYQSAGVIDKAVGKLDPVPVLFFNTETFLFDAKLIMIHSVEKFGTTAIYTVSDEKHHKAGQQEYIITEGRMKYINVDTPKKLFHLSFCVEFEPI